MNLAHFESSIYRNVKRIICCLQKGEKMSPEEVNAVLRLADVNGGGKLDYNKVM